MVAIYALTCLANGKAYIGATRGKIAKRFREHRCLLASGRHSEKLLIEDWQKHGPEQFAIEVVFELEDDISIHVLRGMEKFAMQRYKAAGLLYNQNESCFEPMRSAIEKSAAMHVNLGRKLSAWHIQRLRETQLGVPKNHGHKISATKQAKKAMR